MKECPIPANEAERLAAVHAYRLLDTPPEVEFDVTTRIAARLFDVPIALVALMDKDRLWFKSRHGLDVEQLDREIAFCAHAIVKPDELLVIEDLRSDSRFADNPLVNGGPMLRFYAGAPLRDRNGLALGTIAVLATEPRPFDAEQQALLGDLAISVMTAIEARHRALELEQLATTDALTGLANRVQFEVALALELRKAARSEQSVAVLYTDLDGFKEINDRFGHNAGDAVLREVGRRLLPQMRAGETLARMGGDEFAVVMRAGADLAAATALAERLVEMLKPPIALPGGERVSVGMSSGIAVQDARSAESTALLAQADQALYRAKSQATRRWAVFDGAGAEETVVAAVRGPDQAKPENSAARAEGAVQPFAFSMAFQPVVCASEGTVFAYEALVRGPAGEPAAAVLDQVTRRNRYAFDQGCRRTAIELAARLGVAARGTFLSINFLPSAMYEPETCVRGSIDAAGHAGFPLDKLIFETAEREEVLESERLARIFDVYRKHGFRPAVDDFGAGYAGLKLLAAIKPSLIKIDRQLVSDIHTSRAKQSIVRGILSVCRDLDVTVIAQGVETRAEYAALRDLGIDLFQGFLLARPTFEALPEPVLPV